MRQNDEKRRKREGSEPISMPDLTPKEGFMNVTPEKVEEARSASSARRTGGRSGRPNRMAENTLHYGATSTSCGTTSRMKP